MLQPRAVELLDLFTWQVRIGRSGKPNGAVKSILAQRKVIVVEKYPVRNRMSLCRYVAQSDACALLNTITAEQFKSDGFGLSFVPFDDDGRYDITRTHTLRVEKTGQTHNCDRQRARPKTLAEHGLPPLGNACGRDMPSGGSTRLLKA
ncbi:MAG: hypothetical protein ABJ327_21575 [Litoreibacter sp.]